MGGAGDDNLDGDRGDDLLIGGTGNDTLNGGSGNDRYQFGYGDGQDVINNYDSSTTNTDALVLDETLSINDVWLSRNGNNLQVNLVGSDDQVTINNWYSSDYYQLEKIEVGSSVLLNNQVDQLVSAMASFSVPSGVGNVVPQDVSDGLQPILVESWRTA